MNSKELHATILDTGSAIPFRGGDKNVGRFIQNKFKPHISGGIASAGWIGNSRCSRCVSPGNGLRRNASWPTGQSEFDCTAGIIIDRLSIKGEGCGQEK